MVSVELSIVGLERLQEQLRSYPDRYEAAFGAALNDLSPQIISRIRALLPVIERAQCGAASEDHAHPWRGSNSSFRNITKAS